jgi:serine/threonine protein kinase
VLENYGGLSEKIIKKYLKNIIDGIIYLSSSDIKLKNLKSSNILLEINGNLKLTDFLDYKSIIEFYEIYINSNFKNLRNSEKFQKHPFPWMLKSKSHFHSGKEFDLRMELNTYEKINFKFLAFLMLEMQTGNNADYLKENFLNFKDGVYDNEAVKSKSFPFPLGVSEEFVDLFYAFFEENISVEILEKEILKHNFFEKNAK